MSLLTKKDKKKIKGFTKEAGNVAWYTFILMVVLLVILCLIGGAAFLYLMSENAEEIESQSLGNIYEGRSYYPTEAEGHNVKYYIDFVDLGVEPLNYAYEGQNKSNLPLTKHTEYVFSMIDDLEAPTEELTLHYRVWDTVDPFFTGRKVNSLKKRAEEITVPELDYGADEAYWLGDDLLLRYGKSHLILFYSDTTRELIDSEVCAGFMQNNMQLEKPTWY